jgi:hypothetical protein
MNSLVPSDLLNRGFSVVIIIGTGTESRILVFDFQNDILASVMFFKRTEYSKNLQTNVIFLTIEKNALIIVLVALMLHLR